MAKTRKKSSSPLTPLLITLSLLVAIFGVYAYTRFQPVSTAEIFQLETVSLQSGPVVMEGVIRKDSPLGQSGSYLLILPTGQPVALEITDLDFLVGLDAVIAGDLTLPTTTDALPTLIVQSITTN